MSLTCVISANGKFHAIIELYDWQAILIQWMKLNYLLGRNYHEMNASYERGLQLNYSNSVRENVSVNVSNNNNNYEQLIL